MKLMLRGNEIFLINLNISCPFIIMRIHTYIKDFNEVHNFDALSLLNKFLILRLKLKQS